MDKLHKYYQDFVKLGESRVTVYSAKIRKTGEEVAIKLVPIQNVVSEEAILMNKVKDVKGVVKLIRIHYLDDFVAYVMTKPKRCMDLYDYIGKQPNERLSEEKATNFFTQIVTICIELFKRKVIHGDIKDENIVIDLDTESVMLVDFGSSYMYKDRYFTVNNGTIQYNPPEWYTRKKFKAEPATVWSLGILLYVMLCGDVPFEKPEKIVARNLIFSEYVSEKAMLTIYALLTVEEDYRPSLEEIFTLPLFR